MARRRWARPTGPKRCRPSPSGPRWRSVSRMRTRRAGSTDARGSSFRMPAMPHMPLPLDPHEEEARAAPPALDRPVREEPPEGHVERHLHLHGGAEQPAAKRALRGGEQAEIEDAVVVAGEGVDLRHGKEVAEA